MTANLLILSISALLLLAAWRDVATRLVPDAISIGIGVLGLALQVGATGGVPWGSIGAAVLVFVALLLMCMGGLLGGADMKVAAALALALPPGDVPAFILATTLVGGLMGIAYAMRPRLAAPAGHGLLHRVMVAETRRLRRGGPLPYCVALAAGGILSLLTLPGH